MKRAKAGDSKVKSKPAAIVDSTSDKNDDDEEEEEVSVPKGKRPKKQAKPKKIRTPAEEARAKNFHKFMARAKPANLGQKQVPKGAQNCFANKAFVLTGVCESFTREQIVEIVEEYGGKVTSGVSRKTSYLIVGRDPGDSKINKAEELMISQLDEDQFLDLLKQSNKSGDDDDGDDKEEEEGEDKWDDDDDD